MSCRRSQLSVEQRLQILKQLEAGLPIKTVATKFNVLPRTINRIKNNARHIFEFAERGDNLKKRQSLRKPNNEELDSRLYMWFLQQAVLQNPVSDLLLLERATELSKEITSSSNFKASKGWLHKFKERHNIRLRKIYGDIRSVNTMIAEKFVQDFAQWIEEESISYENIYNMSETSLIWKAVPTKILMDDNITVGLCANVLGTHKLKPLFIHKYKHPRAIKNSKDSLPVFYKSQPNAWINQSIFREWYDNDFKVTIQEYQSKKGIQGKVILLVNNCHPHILSEKLENEEFEIVLLPPNITSILQPMDQGIIYKMKRLYRHKMTKRILTYANSINQFYKTYNIKDCIDLVSEAWEDVGMSTIKIAWRKLITNMTESNEIKETSDSFESDLRNIMSRITGENFLEESIPKFLLTCDEMEKHYFEEDKDSGDNNNKTNKSYSNDNDRNKSNDDYNKDKNKNKYCEYDNNNHKDKNNEESNINKQILNTEQVQQDNQDKRNERENEVEYLFKRLEWHARNMPHPVHSSLNALRETFLHFS